MTLSLEPIATLLAPVAVAMAAWVGHIVVRGTRVSEMRQKWIDDQRADLALFISRAHLLVELAKSGVVLNEERAEAIKELEAAAARIKLRENPINPEWSDVINRIEGIREIVHNPARSKTDLSSLAGGIIASSRSRLKIEWNLVRDGEKSYRDASRRFWRWFCALMLLAAVILYASEAFANSVDRRQLKSVHVNIGALCSGIC